MPTYLYLCKVNNVEFEEVHSIKIVLEECPICKEKNLEQHVPSPQISGGSGRGIVELSTSEIIAKTKEDARKFQKEVYSNEKTYANFIGEAKYESIQQGLDRGKRNRPR